MGLLERAKGVIKANLGEMLSKAEDPEIMIKHWIEESKNDLAVVTNSVAESMAAEKVLQKQMDEAKKEAKYWEDNARTALNAGREDLATKALENQEKIEQRIKGLENPLAETHSRTEVGKERMKELKEEIEDAQNNAEILIARAKSAKASQKAAETISKISKSSPLSEIGRMEQKIMETESKSEALDELNQSSKDTLDDEIKKLSSSSNVSDKLAKMKAEMTK